MPGRNRDYEAQKARQREYRRNKRKELAYREMEREKAKARRASPKGQAYYRQYRERNRDKLSKYHTDYIKRRRQAGDDPRKALMVEARKAGCLICGEKTECCLSFHHVNPRRGGITVAMAAQRSLAAVMRELKGCVCLCENCHRKVHAGLVQLPARCDDANTRIEGPGTASGGLPGSRGEGVE